MLLDTLFNTQRFSADLLHQFDTNNILPEMIPKNIP